MEERVASLDVLTSNATATDWSRDGRFIIYDARDRLRRTSEILALPLAGTKTQPMSLVRNGFYNYGARLSPDGLWLAHTSSQDGAFAVYVQRFVDGSNRTRVTSGGGVHPRWTDDGKTIIFWAEPGGVSSVDLTFGPSGLRAGQPQPIVSDRIAVLLDGRTHFDATRDGRRFLLRQSVGQTPPTVKVLSIMSLSRTQTALGAFYRRLAARIGKPQAITAAARKLAILVYRALKGDLVYRDPGAHAYDLQQRTRVLRRIRQRAATLGFDLVNRETGEVLPAAVS